MPENWSRNKTLRLRKESSTPGPTPFIKRNTTKHLEVGFDQQLTKRIDEATQPEKEELERLNNSIEDFKLLIGRKPLIKTTHKRGKSAYPNKSNTRIKFDIPEERLVTENPLKLEKCKELIHT